MLHIAVGAAASGLNSGHVLATSFLQQPLDQQAIDFPHKLQEPFQIFFARSLLTQCTPAFVFLVGHGLEGRSPLWLIFLRFLPLLLCGSQILAIWALRIGTIEIVIVGNRLDRTRNR